MASIAREKNGNRRILFVAPDGKRPTIRLGKVSQRAAEAVKFRVEQLLAAKLTGHAVEADTARWLAELDHALAKKLARVGLIPDPEAKPAATLGEHLESYFASRADVKPATRINWGHSQRLLLAFFGEHRPLASITPGDAKDWERWLRTAEAREHRYGEAEAGDGLAANTARKRVSNAKQFFQDAVNRDLLSRNPFAGLKGAVGSNRERDYFLTREDAAKIADACPDHEWRLIFALSRFGGLRCPSEHLALRWSDIDWARGTMLVRSPKTEHHEGKGTRIVPLFPELRGPLDEAWERAEPGQERVITRYCDANQNLRTTFEKIIRRAGLQPWPKLFHNLRASRATELAAEHPAHVAAAWLGHSTLVANKHYWQVTDADLERAIGSGEQEEKAAQNPAQQAHVSTRTEPQAGGRAHEKTPVFQVSAAWCESLQNRGMGGTGLEPPPEYPIKTAVPAPRGAESGALGARPAPADPQLAALIAAWPALPTAIKAGILALVQSVEQA